jgi:malignant T-cell-amplified sequence
VRYLLKLSPAPPLLEVSLSLPPRSRSCSKDRLSFIILGNEPLFFRVREGPYFPTLRLLHQYPFMMSRLQVDKGAIKFVIKGADIMCPGLTSGGGDVSLNLPELAPVAIYAEGMEHALAVGFTKMSTQDIKSINKGVGVETVHSVGDELWSAKFA